MASLLSFRKSAKSFSNFLVLICSVCQIFHVESKSCQVRCKVQKPVLTCIAVPCMLFQKRYECPGVFPVFFSLHSVYLGKSVGVQQLLSAVYAVTSRNQQF